MANRDKPVLGVFYWHNLTRRGNLELVNQLRDQFKILLISNESADYLNRYSDWTITEHFGNPKEVLRKVKRHKEKRGLHGTINLSEGAVTLEADIGSELGLLSNCPKEARFARNKHLMREMFRSEKIPSPDSWAVHNEGEAIDTLKNYLNNGPAFLKAPCIGGSAFCLKIKDEGDIRRNWNHYFLGSLERTKKDPLFGEMFGINGENYYMLLEEFLGGTKFDYDDVIGPHYPVFEVSVEGFANKDRTLIYSMTDKPLPLQGVMNGEEYMWRMHSRVPPALKEILALRVNKINRALKTVKGGSHTEFRIEQTDEYHADINFEGKHYRARVIETAQRIGGAYMQPAIYQATGFNSIRAMAYQACNLKHDEQVRFRIPMIMACLWPKKGGRLKKIDGLDKILGLKEKVLRLNLYDSIGEVVQVPPEASRGIGDVLLCGESTDLLKVPGWEILRGESSLYKSTEDLYIYAVKSFKARTE